MKAKAWLFSVLFAVMSAQYVLGQANCVPGTGAAIKYLPLVCQFPISAVTLSQSTFGLKASLIPALNAAVPINAAIAAQLTQLPIPSATVGVISVKKKGSEVPAAFKNLGPILTDRPETVGRGNVFAGFNYQHFNFNSLDGFNLNSLPIAFTFTDPLGTSTLDPKTYYGAMTNKVSFTMNQYVVIATAGVTQSTDLSIVIPVNTVNVSVTSSNFQAYEYHILGSSYSNNTPAIVNPVASSGSAVGLGDITIGLKQMLVGLQHTRAAAAVGATFRFPTGDSFNYLGSGADGGTLYGLVEYRARFAPHVKIAYQWNNQSKVLDLVGGGRVALPGGLQYAAGTDFKAFNPLTLNVDFLGSQFVNTPYFTQNTYSFNPAPSPTSGVPGTYNEVTTPEKTYTTVNFSGGMKLKVGHFLLYGNALIQTNNVGLRPDIAPSCGLAYYFSHKAKN